MKRIRLRTITVFGLAATTGALLLHTSQNVQVDEDRLAVLKLSIEQEKSAIRALNAEWAALNNPERLEKLAKQYLDLGPPAQNSLIYSPADIPSGETLSSAPIEKEKAQPVSLSSPVPSVSPPQPSPAKNPDKASVKNFHTLLKNLGKGGRT